MLAVDDRIIWWAGELRKAGLDGGTDEIRARAYLALFPSHIMNRDAYMLRFPEISCAAVKGPSPPTSDIQTGLYQCSAGLHFDIPKNALWRCLSRDDQVNVIRAHVDRFQVPSSA